MPETLNFGLCLRSNRGNNWSCPKVVSKLRIRYRNRAKGRKAHVHGPFIANGNEL